MTSQPEPAPTAPGQAALRRHLEDTRIAGDVATTREDNLLKYGMFAAGLSKVMFGFSPRRSWTFGEVLALMSRRVGVSPDAGVLRGADRIDPDLTIAALDRAALQIAAAAHPARE